MNNRLRTQLSALAASAALAAIGVAWAQTGVPADPSAMPATTAADVSPMAPAPVAPVADNMTSPAPLTVEPLPQRVVIIAEPEPVAEPAGLMAPLDRAGVRAEFAAMRDAGVLVPAGEAGDTEATAQQRAAYHQKQADEWVTYRDRLAEARWANQQALEQQAALDRAREAELQADQPEPAAMPVAPQPAVN